MGYSAAAIAAVAVVSAFVGYTEHEDAKETRAQAEKNAAKQRESLAALQAEPTPVIPIADDKARVERRRSITAQMRRRGRSSTILTDSGGSGDTLGA